MTSVLAALPATAPLFAGLSERDWDLGGDVGGERRAALAGRVVSAMAGKAHWRGCVPALLAGLDEVRGWIVLSGLLGAGRLRTCLLTILLRERAVAGL